MQMNWTEIEGKWAQLKGDAKSQWAKLTDDDLKIVEGRFDSLVGKVIERYGVQKDQARAQVTEWADRVGQRLQDAGRAVQHRTDQASNDLRGGSRH
jgi:uncharacterized protein YjbJ (UPF0337 family)